MHNASSLTGTPKPAAISAKKYASGGVDSALSVTVCSSVEAFDVETADFEKALIVPIVPWSKLFRAAMRMVACLLDLTNGAVRNDLHFVAVHTFVC